ncbi:MAG: carbohydrate kinase family protein [Nanobdellota archaeon]
MSEEFDVITIGSATVDVFADTTSELVKFVTSSGEKDFISYPLGSKILISHLDVLVGGGGTNTAVSFSRLGLKTGFMGKIGRDENGSKVKKELQSQRVSFLGQQGGQTGYSVVLDSIEQDRTILTFKGANNSFSFSSKSLLPTTKWLYASSMVGYSFESLQALFETASSKGVRCAFNPSSYQVKKGYDELSSLLEKCDVIIMNLEEAQTLLDSDDHPATLAKHIRCSPKQHVIITLGSKGAICVYKQEVYHIKTASNTIVHETTGAGDAFGSGFVSALIKGEETVSALKKGLVQAESVIGRKGAKRGLCTLTKMEQLVSEKKYEIQKKALEKYPDLEVNHHTSSIQEQSLSMRKTSPQHAFVWSETVRLQCVFDLEKQLRKTDDKIFSKFVSSHKNDFSSWIRNVFGYQGLADALDKTTDRKTIILLLEVFRTTKR